MQILKCFLPHILLTAGLIALLPWLVRICKKYQ